MLLAFLAVAQRDVVPVVAAEREFDLLGVLVLVRHAHRLTHGRYLEVRPL